MPSHFCLGFIDIRAYSKLHLGSQFFWSFLSCIQYWNNIIFKLNSFLINVHMVNGLLGNQTWWDIFWVNMINLISTEWFAMVTVLLSLKQCIKTDISVSFSSIRTDGLTLRDSSIILYTWASVLDFTNTHRKMNVYSCYT